MHNGTQQAEVRVQIPCKIVPELFELSEISSNDTFVLKRNFGLPTRLDESQTVTLELAEFEGAVQVVINSGSQEEVSFAYEGEKVSFDVTQALQMKNRFEVEFDSLPGFAGEVQLVIEDQ